MSAATELATRPVAKITTLIMCGVALGFAFTGIIKDDYAQVLLAFILQTLCYIQLELIQANIIAERKD